MNNIDPNIISTLRQHAKAVELDKQAKVAVDEWLKEIEPTDLPVDLRSEKIKMVFSSRWLCFEPKLVSYPYIDSRYILVAGKKKIGYYRLISTIEGEIEDDYFVINHPETGRQRDEAPDTITGAGTLYN
jgi:hypothetical protein